MQKVRTGLWVDDRACRHPEQVLTTPCHSINVQNRQHNHQAKPAHNMKGKVFLKIAVVLYLPYA